MYKCPHNPLFCLIDCESGLQPRLCPNDVIVYAMPERCDVHSPWFAPAQGALYGAKALATGAGPLLFAAMFSGFTKTDSPLPYFPGASLLYCPVAMYWALPAPVLTC